MVNCQLLLTNKQNKIRNYNIIIYLHRSVTGSRITITSPDPSYIPSTGDIELLQNTVYNDSDSVTLDPKTHMKTQKIEGTVEKITLKPRIEDEL